ncbi:DUF2785 domain-containing protein [Vallitalea pronyensis]|uniref:DUF2785 domain-containing protein n=1 Tax=Vallitalea pronyensis TaxID=1348613 RepID=A0A8J8SGH0_9FIRM|nr:DUF2785 domain-containing protein [Vallitalea pronyensis]QUI22347.1 DUF2785 domain-containing protein [Vallitalea pronyensis]
MNDKALKEFLAPIRDNEWKIPADINNDALLEDLLTHIGHIDPVLRDHLVLECLWTLIDKDYLSDDKQKWLLEQLMSEKYLFYGVGKEDNDSVFTRTFSVLIVGVLGYKLQDFDYHAVLEPLIRYGYEEVDYRGYVQGKGWAHATAHLSDALNSFAQHQQVTEMELKKLLALIQAKIGVSKYGYIHGEDERMARTTETIFRNDQLNKVDIINWVKSFKKEEGDYDVVCLKNGNVKNFLRSLYFRLRKSGYDREIIDVIDNVMIEEFSVRY